MQVSSLILVVWGLLCVHFTNNFMQLSSWNRAFGGQYSMALYQNTAHDFHLEGHEVRPTRYELCFWKPHVGEWNEPTWGKMCVPNKPSMGLAFSPFTCSNKIFHRILWCLHCVTMPQTHLLLKPFYGVLAVGKYIDTHYLCALLKRWMHHIHLANKRNGNKTDYVLSGRVWLFVSPLSPHQLLMCWWQAPIKSADGRQHHWQWDMDNVKSDKFA